MRSRGAFALLPALTLLLATAACGRAPQRADRPFEDPNLPIEQRVDSILSLMTLDEKIAALGTDPSVKRLGIRGSDHIEGLHGAALGGPGGWGGWRPVPTTQFPQAVGLGETWDPEIVREAAAAEAEEARYLFQRRWFPRGALVIRAPNADLARDPRWGRSEESYGEDAFLVGTMTTAFVCGLQGDDPRYWKTASLLKHFIANSNEDGRASSSSDFDERLLREYYSEPFRRGVEEGGARAFMTAYNAVNGTPMLVHPMLKSMAVAEWGFDGIICTDAGALRHSVQRHHFFPDLAQAAAASVRAGINQFLDDYKGAVRDALDRGLLTEADIDHELRGVYRVMIRLGLLDPAEMVPYARIGDGPKPWTRPDRRDLARRVTQRSIVLLKNDGILPLDRRNLKSIAVIGPYADEVLLDWYSGTPPYTVSPVEGIQNAAGDAIHVTHVQDDQDGAVERAVAAADVAVVVVGNHPTCDAGWDRCPVPSDGKEDVDRRSITLEQEELVKVALAANPCTVVVLRSSFPYAIQWTQAHAPAIVNMAHNSQEEGNALADVLFGSVNPGGRLVTTWPRSLGDLPPIMDYDLLHGRTYMYAKAEPLYPFGYGLSYTTFAYANLRASSESLALDGTITVSVDLTNTGQRAGDEVVQLYVRHLASKVPRPIRELKGFGRVTLDAGETRTVTLPLAARELAYFDEQQRRFVVEAGPVVIETGASSGDIRGELRVTVGP